MEAFTHLKAAAMPIAWPNCDTDQIVPARYLQKPRTENFGDFLFRDLRSRADGSENPDFALNKPGFRAARIVVAERNFGCGSSREHAVWALSDYGIRVVIAASLGDIFTSNAAKNGLLTIVLPENKVAAMLRALEEAPGLEMAVDLAAQTVTWGNGEVESFEIDPYRKHCLTSGLDELGYTLSQLDKIKQFERNYQG